MSPSLQGNAEKQGSAELTGGGQSPAWLQGLLRFAALVASDNTAPTPPCLGNVAELEVTHVDVINIHFTHMHAYKSRNAMRKRR